MLTHATQTSSTEAGTLLYRLQFADKAQLIDESHIVCIDFDTYNAAMSMLRARGVRGTTNDKCVAIIAPYQYMSHPLSQRPSCKPVHQGFPKPH